MSYVCKRELSLSLSHRESLTQAQSTRVLEVLAETMLFYIKLRGGVVIPELGEFRRDSVQGIVFTPSESAVLMVRGE